MHQIDCHAFEPFCELKICSDCRSRAVLQASGAYFSFFLGTEAQDDELADGLLFWCCLLALDLQDDMILAVMMQANVYALRYTHSGASRCTHAYTDIHIISCAQQGGCARQHPPKHHQCQVLADTAASQQTQRRVFEVFAFQVGLYSKSLSKGTLCCRCSVSR